VTQKEILRLEFSAHFELLQGKHKKQQQQRKKNKNSHFKISTIDTNLQLEMLLKPTHTRATENLS